MDQTNLFHPKRLRPAWDSLPVDARTEVTKLFARMLSVYRERQTVVLAGEMEHD